MHLFIFLASIFYRISLRCRPTFHILPSTGHQVTPLEGRKDHRKGSSQSVKPKGGRRFFSEPMWPLMRPRCHSCPGTPEVGPSPSEIWSHLSDSKISEATGTPRPAPELHKSSCYLKLHRYDQHFRYGSVPGLGQER